MNDRLVRADERIDRSLDQILARLHEHLEPDVVRCAGFLDEPAIECELGVGGGREAHLDFLEAAFHQGLKQFELLADVHGHGQGLIAVAEIHAAPDRRAGEDAVRPLPVGQLDRRERAIFAGRDFEHGRMSIVAARPLCKNKNPTAVWQWGSGNRCDRVKTQPPGCAAATLRRAAMGSSNYDSRRYR